MLNKLPLLLLSISFISLSSYASSWNNGYSQELKKFNKEFPKKPISNKHQNKAKTEKIGKDKTLLVPISPNSHVSVENKKHGSIGISKKFTF